jgi:hypothetical protein
VSADEGYVHDFVQAHLHLDWGELFKARGLKWWSQISCSKTLRTRAVIFADVSIIPYEELVAPHPQGHLPISTTPIMIMVTPIHSFDVSFSPKTNVDARITATMLNDKKNLPTSTPISLKTA